MLNGRIRLSTSAADPVKLESVGGDFDINLVSLFKQVSQLVPKLDLQCLPCC